MMPPSKPLAAVAKGDGAGHGSGSRQVVRVTEDLEKPSLDNRTYRIIRLLNGLEALLVHDAETDKASASLDVNVGSFCDDDDMPGIAHAVEHVGPYRSPPISLRRDNPSRHD